VSLPVVDPAYKVTAGLELARLVRELEMTQADHAALEQTCDKALAQRREALAENERLKAQDIGYEAWRRVSNRQLAHLDAATATIADMRETLEWILAESDSDSQVAERARACIACHNEEKP
jgi:hypothetical protein